MSGIWCIVCRTVCVNVEECETETGLTYFYKPWPIASSDEKVMELFLPVASRSFKGVRI